MDTAPTTAQWHEQLTLEDRVGQMFMVGFQGLTAPAYLLEWLQQGRVGGVILFARNVANPVQLAQLTASLHAAAKYPLLVAIDQEGGTVTRLRGDFSESPGALALSAAVNGPALAEQVDRVLGLEMRALGINWDFAPSLDIFYNAANPAIGTRSFGSTAARVAEMGQAAVRGFQSAAIAACAKHFPGLGSTAIDTHLALPTLDTPLAHLIDQDMPPFRAAIDAGIASIMTTHTIFTELDRQFPATLSPLIIQRLLRQELGFERVVISDCMEMKAIADNFSPADTAVLGAEAGLDIILFSHTRAMQEAAYDGLLAAAKAGQLSHLLAANQRVAELKERYRFDPALDYRPADIRTPDHLQTMRAAAQAGLVLLSARQSENLLPLAANDPGVVLVEFASHLESGILESGGSTGLASALKAYAPQLQTLVISQLPYDDLAAAEARVAASSVLIVATRNAHLNVDQLAVVDRLIPPSKRLVVICLRNPHDVSALMALDSFGRYAGPYAIIGTCGDSAPSLQAAADVLYGDAKPTGKLPIGL